MRWNHASCETPRLVKGLAFLLGACWLTLGIAKAQLWLEKPWSFAAAMAAIEITLGIGVLVPRIQGLAAAASCAVAGALLLGNLVPPGAFGELVEQCKCFGSRVTADRSLRRAVASGLLLMSLVVIAKKNRGAFASTGGAT